MVNYNDIFYTPVLLFSITYHHQPYDHLHFRIPSLEIGVAQTKYLDSLQVRFEVAAVHWIFDPVDCSILKYRLKWLLNQQNKLISVEHHNGTV